MQIIFTKVSPTHHRLECVRGDGSRESAILETKSFMPHDLIHYAYEVTAGLKNSFWGLIAQGHSLTELASPEAVATSNLPSEEIILTEKITGPLSGYLKSGADPTIFFASIENMLSAEHIPSPSYLTPAFLTSFTETFRRISGHWQATLKDEPMILDFPKL